MGHPSVPFELGELQTTLVLPLWGRAREAQKKDPIILDTYAREIVAAEFSEGGDAAVVRKVTGDLAAKGIAVTEAEVRAEMTELMAQAVAQVKAGT